MLDHENIGRRKHILESAVRTFTTYGFRRTTMADIAEAAGLSRPALYLVFKNKGDIFRAGFSAMIEDLLLSMQAMLDDTGPLDERITNSIVVGIIVPFRAMLDTPHGAELFDAKQDHAEDLAEDWFQRIESMIAAAVDRSVASGQLSPPAGIGSGEIAHLLVSGIEGIKMRLMATPAAEAELRLLVRLVISPMQAATAMERAIRTPSH